MLVLWHHFIIGASEYMKTTDGALNVVNGTHCIPKRGTVSVRWQSGNIQEGLSSWRDTVTAPWLVHRLMLQTTPFRSFWMHRDNWWHVVSVQSGRVSVIPDEKKELALRLVFSKDAVLTGLHCYIWIAKSALNHRYSSWAQSETLLNLVNSSMLSLATNVGAEEGRRI